MTRAILLCAAAATALSMAGCRRAADTADTTAANVTSPGQTEPVNRAQDVTGSAVGQTSAAVMGARDTGAFVSNAAQSDMYEIEAAGIAEQRARDAGVKAFARDMAADHTKLSNEMKPLITAAGQTPPTGLDQRRKGFIDNLRAAPAADFDKTYMDQQVSAHEEALTLMKGYADSGPDAGLKNAATKAVPIIQRHVDRARQLQAKLSS